VCPRENKLDTNRWNAPVHNGVFRYLIDLLITEESASRGLTVYGVGLLTRHCGVSLPKNCRTFPTPSVSASSSVADQLRSHRGLINVDTLAELLDSSPKSLYAWVKQGRLPAVRLGASVKFDPFITAQWLLDRAA
jgi:excisionase family DNA binding protein